MDTPTLLVLLGWSVRIIENLQWTMNCYPLNLSNQDEFISLYRYTSLFHTTITASVTKISHQNIGPCYIFTYFPVWHPFPWQQGLNFATNLDGLILFLHLAWSWTKEVDNHSLSRSLVMLSNHFFVGRPRG